MIPASPILVTGSHRSGSTWTGQVIASSSKVGYIHEPFNIDVRPGVNPTPFPYWFFHVCKENEAEYFDNIRDILQYRYWLASELKIARKPNELSRIAGNLGSRLYYRAKSLRPLLKDPIALFSAEWLSDSFNCDVVVLIRHPAAFVSSLKINRWTFDFSHFLDQPLLVEHLLEPFEKEMRQFSQSRKKDDIISQGTLLWNCFHYVIHRYSKERPSWKFIRHEDLSRDPLNMFKGLFEKLSLDFSPNVAEKIADSTNSRNPAEQALGFELKRNSARTILTWKNRLTAKEIADIRAGTHEIASNFYSDDEW